MPFIRETADFKNAVANAKDAIKKKADESPFDEPAVSVAQRDKPAMVGEGTAEKPFKKVYKKAPKADTKKKN